MIIGLIKYLQLINLLNACIWKWIPARFDIHTFPAYIAALNICLILMQTFKNDTNYR